MAAQRHDRMLRANALPAFMAGADRGRARLPDVRMSCPLLRLVIAK
jgi:hypothetical protein